ncbi:PAP2 family protein [Trypanosoma conorhini]|uniref:PAP2 family protein n=1 Tax=Trypanosoma conorhini TaxID=83891 RepID=A0A422NQR4_9TRYP|nr:PAP2 family protein [Trypanosoma conorhini]RNF07796.1 PAP2 family protein [Trypanosoma conorhini]
MGERWVVWKATAACYSPRDPLSFLFALLALLPIVVLLFLAGLASAPSFRQQGAALGLLMGLVFNAGVNAMMKRCTRSPRPRHPASGDFCCAPPSAHGMPSDHAQFMFFFITWLMRRAALTGLPMTLGMRAFLIAAALAVSYGRVYNNYHYPMQVIVGGPHGRHKRLPVYHAARRGHTAAGGACCVTHQKFLHTLGTVRRLINTVSVLLFFLSVSLCC